MRCEKAVMETTTKVIALSAWERRADRRQSLPCFHASGSVELSAHRFRDMLPCIAGVIALGWLIYGASLVNFFSALQERSSTLATSAASNLRRFGSWPPWSNSATVRGVALVIGPEAAVLTSVERSGYKPLLAENESGALEMLRNSGDQIRVVVLDLHLSEKATRDAVRRIKNLRPDLPVIDVGSGARTGAGVALRIEEALRQN